MARQKLKVTVTTMHGHSSDVVKALQAHGYKYGGPAGGTAGDPYGKKGLRRQQLADAQAVRDSDKFGPTVGRDPQGMYGPPTVGAIDIPDRPDRPSNHGYQNRALGPDRDGRTAFQPLTPRQRRLRIRPTDKSRPNTIRT